MTRSRSWFGQYQLAFTGYNLCVLLQCRLGQIDKCESVEAAVLGARVEAPLVIGAKRAPGTFIRRPHGTEQFDLEAGRP